jgi:UDP-N-acetylglucosamine--N-acetylmuramyl-(pentapeptide) pyrophosphoryl-undecaprenol N-acetylglucosamine transferase
MLTGTPAVLVPSPHVAADHQTKNAISMAEMGGAHIIAEAEIESRLADDVIHLLGDEPARRRMSENLREQARPDAGDVIARDILRHIEVTS